MRRKRVELARRARFLLRRVFVFVVFSVVRGGVTGGQQKPGPEAGSEPVKGLSRGDAFL